MQSAPLRRSLDDVLEAFAEAVEEVHHVGLELVHREDPECVMASRQDLAERWWQRHQRGTSTALSTLYYAAAPARHQYCAVLGSGTSAPTTTGGFHQRW